MLTSNAEDIQAQLILYKSKMQGEGPCLSDHAHGFYNGLEAALAIVEGRPAFPLSKDKVPRTHDLETYPEYFV